MNLIDEAYAELAELPVEFDRTDLGRILFERTMKQLKDENSSIDKTTIRGRYYYLLSHIVMDLNAYSFRQDETYKLIPKENGLGFSFIPLAKWTPEDL